MIFEKRHKNTVWNVTDESGIVSFSAAQLAVLMDIRDELQALRSAVIPLRRLDCSDFLAIPRTLNRIAKNTHEPKRRRKSATGAS